MSALDIDIDEDSEDIIKITHAANVIATHPKGSRAYDKTFVHDRLPDMKWESLPKDHLAREGNGPDHKYYHKICSWDRSHGTTEEKIARHPANLKAVWGINQVAYPAQAVANLNPKEGLLPTNIAEYATISCPYAFR